MKQSGGWWFTDEEAHFPDWLQKNGIKMDGRLAYQGKKLLASLEYCRSFGTAVDIGGHVGTFSFYLAQRFKAVHAFEPVAQFRECFMRNVATRRELPGMMSKTEFVPLPNVTLHPFALGAAPAMVGMHIVPADTGGTYVSGAGDVEMRTLDSFDLQEVGYVKIDAEGFEDKIISGARETLLRCKPCVMVENKKHKLSANFGIAGTPAVDLLKSMGYTLRREMSGDFMMTLD